MTKPLKVAICGTSPSSCQKAPYDNEAWEIWSLGGNIHLGKRFTRWFEMHTQRVLRNAGTWDVMFQFFGECKEKLVLGHPCDELPNATPYPIEEIKAKFGKYFTSSIAYMIALAIHEGATEIGLWGIDMLADEEYGGHRPCCEYLLGIAQGKGINVIVAEESPLLHCERMYAYEYPELSAEIAGRMKEIEMMCDKTTQAMLEANHNKSFWAGRRFELQQIHKKFG